MASIDPSIPADVIESFIDKADTNHDGHIDLEVVS